MGESEPVAEDGFIPPDRLLDRTLNAQRSRQLRIVLARPTRALVKMCSTCHRFRLFFPITGIGFLRHLHLLVDVQHREIVDPQSSLTLAGLHAFVDQIAH